MPKESKRKTIRRFDNQLFLHDESTRPCFIEMHPNLRSWCYLTLLRKTNGAYADVGRCQAVAAQILKSLEPHKSFEATSDAGTTAWALDT